MAVIISKADIKKMASNVLDPETGITEFDLFEFNHSQEDWQIV